MSKTVLAIDIGSNKICAVIAKIADDNTIDVIGTGITRAQGLKRGSITNIEQASKSIKLAVNDANRVSGTDIKSAVVSISGAYTKSLKSNGIVNVQAREIKFEEIERVMQTALYNANVPSDYDVLHALPYNFKVDDQDFIEDPLGMNASRLEVQTHIITTQKSNLNNLKKAVNGAGIDVENVVLNGYASSIATINDDEKELGAAVIDIGGSTSNIVIHAGNAIRYNDFLGVGSNHITSDLSMAIHTPLNVADTVKLNYGSLLTSSNDLIELPTIGDEENTHEVSLEVVNNVIFARVEETLMILSQFIDKSMLKEQIGAGVILTGGFSKLEGIKELAVATFGSIPVRLAKPKVLDGLSDNIREPEFACSVGLVMYMASGYTKYEIDVNKRVRHSNEIPIEDVSVKLTSQENQESSIPQVQPSLDIDIEKQAKMFSLEDAKKEKKSDEASALNKIWNWASQLF